MTVDELYDHITSHMTPENALRKSLSSSLLSYEKLRFDKGEEVHPILIINMAALDLNWQIALESNKKNIEGLTIGTEEYMKRNLEEE